MNLTLVLIAIGILLLIMLCLNLMSQYLAKRESDRKQIIASHLSKANETEEIIQASSKLPLSRDLILVLYRRIQTELQLAINHNAPDDVQTRLNDTAQQYLFVQQSYQPLAEHQYHLPEEEQKLLGLFNLLKRLITILQLEHKRGNLDSELHDTEMKHLFRLREHAEAESLLVRAIRALKREQAHTAEQFLDRLEDKLQSMPAEQNHSFINKKQEQIRQWRIKLEEKAESAASEPLDESPKEVKPKLDDIDAIFQQKKKW